MSLDWKEPETLEEWRQFFDTFRRRSFAREERSLALALRVQSVCRNCAHAGNPIISGNDPYTRAWGSCRKRPPIAREGSFNEIEQYTSAPQSVWPTVRHDMTCGEFALVPLSEAESKPLTDVYWPNKVPWASWAPAKPGQIDDGVERDG